jgi:tetratricopeptide (TPR) repeat protein
VVTGSVQQNQEGFRVTAQLIEANTGIQLWTSRYNLKNAEFLEIRDEITRSIAATLMTTDGQIAKAELRRQTRKSPESFSEYDHYLKGRDLLHRSILPPWENGKNYSELAKAEFTSLIQENPASDLPIYAGLAWQHAIDFDWGYGDPEKSVQLAFDNAVIAVKQWPDNHLAQWVMGWAQLFAKRDYARATYHYNRARELNVGDSRLLAEMAQLLIYTGDYQRAIEFLNQAIRLNPLHEQWYDEFLAWAYEEIGDPERTIELLRSFRELEGLSGYGVMARACFTTGRIEQFRGLIETMEKLSQDQTGKHFSVKFWKHWVEQKEPYQDPARTDRVIATIAEGLEQIGWQ